METITVNITDEMIRVGIEKCITEALKNSYSNPVNDAVNASIKESGGAIKKVVDEIIVSAVTSAEFKTKIADIVIAKMVESSLKK